MAFRTTSACKTMAVLGLLGTALSCSARPRFPLREPLVVDDDQRPFSPAPAEYYSPFAWDGANQMVFRPVARFFAIDPAGRAVNVDAFDEVLDSSWFQNRLGTTDVTEGEVTRGSCARKILDPSVPDGSWVVDRGKDNGANPGFRVNVPGLGKFMLKTDPAAEPERATGATAVASRIYHAFGFFAPCDTVVYFRPSLLKLTPGLTVTNNEGVTTPFDEAALSRILTQASHRDGLVRMVASSWLPGKPIGPYRYDGVRDDDPNDVIAHDDRRELRGARLVAAWLNHFDSREQNTLDVFLPAKAPAPTGSGYVRHYIIDMGDCFGSVWSSDHISRRLGHSYVFDPGYLVEDFLTLGAVERPWERAARTGGTFAYFSARDFDPELWRGEYPNPAFMRMTEGDGAWAARILAHFDDALLASAVRVGQYDEKSERYLFETLRQRRDAILKRYLSRLSPLSRPRATESGFCSIDLARRTGVVPNESVSLRSYLYRERERGAGLESWSAGRVIASPSAEICLELTERAGDGGLPDDAPERYRVVEIWNGYAKGPLRVSMYDLGKSRGVRVVGVERPETSSVSPR